jgi:hypothetical protein
MAGKSKIKPERLDELLAGNEDGLPDELNKALAERIERRA